MADRAPLVFQVRLGGLFPASAVAQEAMRELRGKVRIDIHGGVANERRRGLYWTVAHLVTPILNEAHQLTLTEQDLHDLTRQKLGLGEWIELPSGDRLFKPRSTANRSMNEADRADYTNRAFGLWSTWCRIPVETLTAEAKEVA